MPRLARASCGHSIWLADAFSASAALCPQCGRLVPLVGNATSPSRGLAITGAVIAIVASCLYLMLGGFVLLIGGVIFAFVRTLGDAGGLFLWAAVFTFVALAGIILGALACTCRPRWLLASTLVQGLFTVFFGYFAVTDRSVPALPCALVSLSSALLCGLASRKTRPAR